MTLWAGLAALAEAAGDSLAFWWVAWPYAWGAAAAWVAIGLVLVVGYGPPYQVSRPPYLAVGFAALMTLLGSGSYWATTQLYPQYRVPIERAAWLLAACMLCSLVAGLAARPLLRRGPGRARLEWDWPRLQVASAGVFVLAVVGTLGALGRIGYVPLLTGDPISARVDFPAGGGIWYRLSMLGGVAAILAGLLIAARRATVTTYVTGLTSLFLVGLYGPRFFVALPLGVGLLLWDRFRTRLRIGVLAAVGVLSLPALALLGYLRQRDPSAGLLGPLGLLVYGSFGEFRDLGWMLDHYGTGERFLQGATLGGVVVPLLPRQVWALLGVDKMAVYARNSASILADDMGQVTGQRVGVFGEFFMNYGWSGALVGAVACGLLLVWLDERLRTTLVAEVRSVVLALAAATATFALVGQLNMFTSTLTGVGYPLGLVALVAARRAR